MHRLCIICAALASLIALLAMLAPSPATAQDELSSTVKFGEGESPKVVVATLNMLGNDKALPDFKLLVLYQKADGSNHNITCITDAKGKLRMELFDMPKRLRVFAYGDYVIPEGWSNVPIATMKFEKEEPWAVQVRPLKRVRVTGKISVAGLDKPAVRANVAFAPLDVAQDGTFKLFDEPRGTLADEDGNYEIELPTGYYQVWAYWADRSLDDWPGYIKVIEKTGVFEDQTLDMVLAKGPTIRGRVIDGRTGEGVAASINLYTNQYLRQLRNWTADGRMPDEEGPDGEEIYWPVGTFNIQAWMINPDDFTVVIRPAGSDQVLRVISNLKLGDVQDKEQEWELYTEDMRVVDVKIQTHKVPLPVNELDINLLPLKIDVPEHLAQSYTASGYTNDAGTVRFMGLATGTYEVYGARGSMFMGKIEVTDKQVQELVLEYAIPFATGTVKLPGGEVCTNMVLFKWIRNQVDQEFGPYSQDAFLGNPALKADGKVFVPLLQRGSKFRVRFAAMQDGKEFKDGDWMKIDNFPLVTEEVVIEVNDEKVWELDLKLVPNPDFKPMDQPKED
ncbi:MAG: hypothetical protein K8I27_09605 [Planctomycetes bacterium]|nr:hypothetical protein [Planctomycetota bacterium]